MRDIIIGTAGHIDHGKTALIEAMTGYNGDELAQEKERGITIDLSFCNIYKDGVNIAFIDVPGHKGLIKTMVSGAFSFDIVLLVIDIDEGIMPQTLEHLAVLNILGIHKFIIVLTKIDKINKEEIFKKKEEIEEFIKKEYPNIKLYGTFLTSIYEYQTIESLKSTLFKLPIKKYSDSSFFRYYIDRVFSPKGIGTVVTGTLLSGEINKGDKIIVAELNRVATIRNIQVHNRDRDKAYTNQRVALNLDISHTKLKTGYLLASRGYFRGFDRIDVSISILEGKRVPHSSEILFISGSKQVVGKILYFSNKAYATIQLKERVYTRFGDSYILLSSGRVVGGGEILIPISEPIRKSSKVALLKALKSRDFISAFETLLKNHKRGLGLISSEQRFAISHNEALEIACKIKGSYLDEKALVLYPKEAMSMIESSIRYIYEINPNALLSPASIVLRFKWASESLVLEVMEYLSKEKFLKRVKGLYLRFDRGSNELIDTLPQKLYKILEEGGLTPKAPYDIYESLNIDRKIGDKALRTLSKDKRVIHISNNIFITQDALNQALSFMRELIVKYGYLDIHLFKNETNMSRKYLIAYLEYLDKQIDIIKKANKRFLKFKREGE